MKGSTKDSLEQYMLRTGLAAYRALVPMRRRVGSRLVAGSRP